MCHSVTKKTKKGPQICMACLTWPSQRRLSYMITPVYLTCGKKWRVKENNLFLFAFLFWNSQTWLLIQRASSEHIEHLLPLAIQNCLGPCLENGTQNECAIVLPSWKQGYKRQKANPSLPPKPPPSRNLFTTLHEIQLECATLIFKPSLAKAFTIDRASSL